MPSLSGSVSFDLILAADVVWLDELVEPLVRTLERLTAGWPSCGGGDGRAQQSPQARQVAPTVPSARERGLSAESVQTAHANGFAQECQRAAVAASSPEGSSRPQRPMVGQRVLLAYQWRSQRTGKALLEELEKAFRVREIQPEVRRRHQSPWRLSACVGRMDRGKGTAASLDAMYRSLASREGGGADLRKVPSFRRHRFLSSLFVFSVSLLMWHKAVSP